MISLDGAAAQDLFRLHREGRLRAGLERAFAEGEVAEALIPVSPASTSTNHASLATGFPPAITGIVSNAFHVAGRPLGERAGGLYTPIGAETLWQAAHRQGKRVGVVAFPGFDSVPRGDWGHDWPRTPAAPSQLIEIAADGWHALVGPARLAAASPSFSPPLGATLAATGCDAVAIDRSDDGRVDYDALLVPCADPSGRTVPALSVGAWQQLLFDAPHDADISGSAGPEPPRAVAAWAKLMTLDPASAATRLYLGAAYSPSGYPESYVAALRRAGLVWPGSPDEHRVAAAWRGEPGIDLETWFEQERRLTQFLIDAMIAGWRVGDTDLVMGYIPALDQAGHLLLLEDPRQAGYSETRRDERRRMRERVWQLVDSELGRLLAVVDLSTTTVALVSDHGMEPVHSAIDINAALERAGLLAFSSPERIDPTRTQAWAVGYGGVAHVYANLIGREPAGIVAPADLPALLARLRAELSGIAASQTAVHPVAAVYSRAEAAPLGLDSEHSGDLIAFAAPGYVFRAGWRQGAAVVGLPTSYGDHGYFNDLASMRAIFLAIGGGVHRRSTGPQSVLDIAPRVAAWLGIDPPVAGPPPARLP